MNVSSIQDFNLHAHHGGFGLYNGKRTGADGHNNALRMLKTAQIVVLRHMVWLHI